MTPKIEAEYTNEDYAHEWFEEGNVTGKSIEVATMFALLAINDTLKRIADNLDRPVLLENTKRVGNVETRERIYADAPNVGKGYQPENRFDDDDGA